MHKKALGISVCHRNLVICNNNNLADNNLKKQIARELGLPQHLYLESWIKSLSVFLKMLTGIFLGLVNLDTSQINSLN